MLKVTALNVTSDIAAVGPAFNVFSYDAVWAENRPTQISTDKQTNRQADKQTHRQTNRWIKFLKRRTFSC